MNLNIPRAKNPGWKAWVLKLVFSRFGPLIKAGAATATAFVVTSLAKVGIVLSAEMQLHLMIFLTGLAWLGVDSAIQRYAGAQAAIIQEALGVEKDRWLGPKTVAAAQALPARRAEVVEDLILKPENFGIEQWKQIQAIIDGSATPPQS